MHLWLVAGRSSQGACRFRVWHAICFPIFARRQQRAPHALACAWGSFMSTDRSRRRKVGSRKNGHAPGSKPVRIHLAPGVRLDGADGGLDAPVLVCPGGNVQLNEGAAAILRLCDGSRDRAAIIAEIARLSSTSTLADDIVEFLNVASARGWIVGQ